MEKYKAMKEYAKEHKSELIAIGALTVYSALWFACGRMSVSMVTKRSHSTHTDLLCDAYTAGLMNGVNAAVETLNAICPDANIKLVEF